MAEPSVPHDPEERDGEQQSGRHRPCEIIGIDDVANQGAHHEAVDQEGQGSAQAHERNQALGLPRVEHVAHIGPGLDDGDGRSYLDPDVQGEGA